MSVSRCTLTLLATCMLLPLPAAAQENPSAHVVGAAGPASAMPITPLPTARDPHAIPLLSNAQDTGEQWESFMGARIVRNVTAPTLTPFLPDPAKATGTAVVVAPGGAFMMLSIDSEGYEVARWLADHGIAAFLLKYRLKPTPRDPAAFLGQLTGLLSGIDKTTPSTPPEALADAQAAVRLIRQRSGAWHVDPRRVGFVGFSAGAMTTLSVGLNEDSASRPDFIAPIYGPMTARPVPGDAPPMFTAMAMDDPFFGHSDLGLIAAYQAALRPIEVHLFEAGGHGFGMRKQGKSSDLWIEELYTWMKDRGLLKPQP
ncbi:alpha/beta hydrolase [Novosphingobium terrae]|uniref:alpha/beta hydrolase n=1 Tax=Novosphingobium terrae TaxID=2726189 RepID=UPI00197F9222|nr:alpha/beta hydrolase [Novosphingobium terrae]